MNDDQKLKETLSALMDGEAGKEDQLELRRLARSLNDHPDLIATYQRYIQVRTVITGEPTLRPSNSLLNNIRHAIDHDETMEEIPAAMPSSAPAAGGQPSRHWLNAFGRVAVAASVAIVAVILVQMHTTSTTVPASSAVVAQTEAQRDAADPVVAHSNRMLNPSVLTVSAGNRSGLSPTQSRESATVMSGCVLDVHRSDQSEAIWERPLPAGYSLCKQNSTTHQCEVVSEKIGCYLH